MPEKYTGDQPYLETQLIDWILHCAELNECSDYAATFANITSEKKIAAHLEHLQEINRDHENTFSAGQIREIASNIMISMKNAIASDNQLFICWQLIAQEGENADFKCSLKSIQEALDSMNSPKVHTGLYQQDFYRTLCLHNSSSGRPAVTLDDVFIMPNVHINGQDEPVPADECVRRFLHESRDNILLLEAHGGYGKSSFVSYMSVHQQEIFRHRKPYIIRLREFTGDRDCPFSIDQLYDRICEKIGHTDQIEGNAVLIFDGLDELSVITGNTEIEKRSAEIFLQLCDFLKERMGRKIIITSRPSHIHANDLQQSIFDKNRTGNAFGDNDPVVQYAEYCRYTESQRQDFAEKLMRADLSITRNDFGCNYIYGLEDGADGADIIYGSPFIMYLICAAKNANKISVVTEEGIQNRWLLFRQVFHDIYPHSAYDIKRDKKVPQDKMELLYEVVCEMAYRMYKSRYKKNVIHHDEMDDIVRTVLEENRKFGSLPEGPDTAEGTKGLIRLLGQNAALCCYMNQKENGALEFAHNHIRDFFLCEYILIGLNRRYADGCDTHDKGAVVADWMSEKFMYADIHNTFLYVNGKKAECAIYDFLKSASLILEEACKNFGEHIGEENLHFVFDRYLKTGGLCAYTYSADYKLSVNTAASNSLQNAIFIFSKLYAYKLAYDKKHIRWFGAVEIKKANEKAETESVLEILKYDLNRADFSGTDLSYLTLDHGDLDYANFSNSNLYGVRFEHTDMRNAIFNKVNLGFARLNDSFLVNAKFIGTNLVRARLINADLQYADFSDADLQHADFSGADLRGADLRTAKNLEDAFLKGAKYTLRSGGDVTRFPPNFNPRQHGMEEV